MLGKLKAKSALVVAAAGMAVVVGAGTASANPNASYIGYGYTTYGSGVWCVQHLINYMTNHPGYTPMLPGAVTLGEDNSFGPATQGMVELLQRSYNAQPGVAQLSVDGVVGPATGNVILNWAHQDPYQPYCQGYIPSS
ncbi:hypothetical protein GCM10009738_46480 [Kitasatospora viridis]|uniref:Peptidoglycan binding protein n=2 Tax=Kitasatospora viridis TaxID=281105 RepID=A0A561UH34_9ACTN|nr:hypothetical protein FHX73_112499 [Kitasatospora viridis]